LPWDPPRIGHFSRSGTGLAVTVGQDSQVLLLSGAPLNEPIVHYGPFVMNTKQELIAAIEDFNSGRFGRLADQSASMP
jgi:redox-sensitive bicupin YhaK (pirin superfamily)